MTNDFFYVFYFDAKEQAIEVLKQAKSGGFKGSTLGKALELEMALEQAREFEEQIKMLFFQANKMDVWARITARAKQMEIDAAHNARRKKEAAKRRQAEIEELMMSESYYMTPLDMLVFAETYQLPVIMFSSVDRSWSVLGGKPSDQFFFYDSVPWFQGWPNNVLMNRTFELNAEFASEFEDKIISVRKYLA